ncbi:MAG: oligogalacturonate lyase family protein [Chloroflexota bacterium]
MGKGQIYQDPQFTYIDKFSNRSIRQLTNYLGHSNHLYFTDPCWFNDNQSFVFASDRGNSSNLFRYDLVDGKITQMTDFAGNERLGACVSQVNNTLYVWHQDKLYEINVDTFEERIVCEVTGKMRPRGRANPTADGQFACTMLMEDQPEENPGIAYSYSRFVEFFETKPLSQIVKINLQTGQQGVIHEDKRYMGHVNTSPTQAHLLSFCHEGPWHRIDQRIWGLDINTGKSWKIRPQDDDNYAIGHEYWFADGERIGYHGRPRDRKGNHVFGHLKWDNSEHIEVNFPFHSTHFHSLDEQMMVGDGTAASVFAGDTTAQPFIQLFRWNGEDYDGPHILSLHRSTFNDQHAHCHPRFTPDGKSILYTSDLTAYSNMYLVEIGDFEDLTALTADTLKA